MPRIEAWARKTGSSCAAEKTELIHITRKRSEQCQGQIIMSGNTITLSTTAKLLGVIFDHELRWKEHVQQVVKRATKVNIALGGLRQLRPEQMRQVHEACVVPVIDYASTVWHDPLRDKTHLRQPRTVQRTALIRVLSAFRTVATSTLEVEAHVPPWTKHHHQTPHPTTETPYMGYLASGPTATKYRSDACPVPGRRDLENNEPGETS